MHVSVIDRQSVLTIDASSLIPLVESVLAAEKQECDEVGIYFVESQELCTLHAQFFGDPSPTDCISFPIEDAPEFSGYRILGEIFVSPLAAMEYAAKKQSDPYRELTLYVVHGLLHLIGYDDMERETRVAMRAAERRHMQRLRRRNLLIQPGSL